MDSDQEVEKKANELPSVYGLPDATVASPTRRVDQAPMQAPQDATSVHVLPVLWGQRVSGPD